MSDATDKTLLLEKLKKEVRNCLKKELGEYRGDSFDDMKCEYNIGVINNSLKGIITLKRKYKGELNEEQIKNCIADSAKELYIELKYDKEDGNFLKCFIPHIVALTNNESVINNYIEAFGIDFKDKNNKSLLCHACFYSFKVSIETVEHVLEKVADEINTNPNTAKLLNDDAKYVIKYIIGCDLEYDKEGLLKKIKLLAKYNLELPDKEIKKVVESSLDCDTQEQEQLIQEIKDAVKEGKEQRENGEQQPNPNNNEDNDKEKKEKEEKEEKDKEESKKQQNNGNNNNKDNNKSSLIQEVYECLKEELKKK